MYSNDIAYKCILPFFLLTPATNDIRRKNLRMMDDMEYEGSYAQTKRKAKDRDE